jgi:BTB/POZ domain-containing protein KCTD9
LERYSEGQGLYADFEQALAGLGQLRKDPQTVTRYRSGVEAALDFPMYDPAEVDGWPESTPELCDLLREVVGNPCRPSRVERQWLTWNGGTVATLARTIGSEKKFDLMPLLGDALEDAGCTDADILAHCRDSRPHVLGCWAVDLLSEEDTPRRPLEETWNHLDPKRQWMPRTQDGRPFVPARMPRPHDEAPLGFSYFRSGLEDADLSSVTLPRTFFGRSELERVNFRNTDLSQSWMCWNDFIDCDFTRADLSRCKMASVFTRCQFIGADLSRADLRRGSFEGCDFTGANMKGAKGDEIYGDEFELIPRLSEKQRKSMKWSEDPGPEPDGG